MKTVKIILISDDGRIINKEIKKVEPGREAVFHTLVGAPLCLDNLAFDVYRLPEEISQKVVKTKVKTYSPTVNVFTIKASDINNLKNKYHCTVADQASVTNIN